MYHEDCSRSEEINLISTDDKNPNNKSLNERWNVGKYRPQ